MLGSSSRGHGRKWSPGSTLGSRGPGLRSSPLSRELRVAFVLTSVMAVGGEGNPVQPVLSGSDEAARETSRAAFMNFIMTIEVPGISHKMRKHEGSSLMSFDEL